MQRDSDGVHWHSLGVGVLSYLLRVRVRVIRSVFVSTQHWHCQCLAVPAPAIRTFGALAVWHPPKPQAMPSADGQLEQHAKGTGTGIIMYSKLLKGSMRRMMCVFWELCPHPEVGDPALSLTDRGHWQGPKAQNAEETRRCNLYTCKRAASHSLRWHA